MPGKRKKENETNEQLFFSTPAGIMKLRYIAVMLGLLSDFMDSDVDNLSSSKDPVALKALLRQKIHYARYLSTELDGNICDTFPQSVRSSKTIESICCEKDIPSGFVFVSPPPEPYIDTSTYMNISSTSRNKFEVTKHLHTSMKKVLKHRYHIAIQRKILITPSTSTTEESIPLASPASLGRNTSSLNTEDILQPDNNNNNNMSQNELPSSVLNNSSMGTSQATTNQNESHPSLSNNSSVSTSQATTNHNESHPSLSNNSSVSTSHASTTDHDESIVHQDDPCVLDIIKEYNEIVKNHEQNKKLISGENWLQSMIDNEKLPVKRSQFFILKKKYMEAVAEGKADTLEHDLVWKKDRGRPGLLKMEEAVSILISDESVNKSIGLKDIRKKLTNIKVRKAVQNGAVGALVKPVSWDTARKFRNILVSHADVGVRKSVNHKNRNRQIGERSVFSAVSFYIGICSTHFIATKTKYRNTPKLKSIKDATSGAKKLYEKVKRYYGRLHVTPVHPSFILSTDDSTVYAVEGVEEKQEEWKLVGNYRSTRKVIEEDTTNVEKINQRNNSTHGVHTNDPSASANLGGKRVRITMTTTASGKMAPIFIAVYGLSERELPSSDYPDGVHIVKIPGLCMGGSQDINNNSYGYLAFVRASNKSKENDDDYICPDTVLYQRYIEEVVRPFMRKTRAVVYGEFNRETTTNDTYDMAVEETDIFKTCVSWCDGGNPQVNVNKMQEVVDASNLEKIVNNKHSRSRSAVEQPNDIMPGFSIIHSSAKCSTALQTPFLDYRNELQTIFKEIRKTKNINLGRKEKHVIDFLTMVPSIFFKAMAPTNIVKGFVGCGMIDGDTYQWPDHDAIMATCKNDIITKQWVQDIIDNNFDKMMDEYAEKGYLSDEFLKGLGLPEDTDNDNIIVVRDTTLKNEKEHRAKTFSHPFWVKVRREIIEEEVNKLREQAQEMSDIVLTHHERNEEIEDMLRVALTKALGEHDIYDPAKPLERITLEMIFNVQVPAANLSSFVYVRKFKEHERGNKIENKNKRKWDEIEAGKSSVIHLIHKHRNDPIILEDPLDCLVRFRRKLGLVENDN